MVRNKYNIDEELENPFSASQLKRAMKYVKSNKRNVILSFILSETAALLSLLGPMFTKIIIDKNIPEKNIKELLITASLFFTAAFLSVLFSAIRDRINAVTGQRIIRDMRRDLYSHVQHLPFTYFDSRPHGKIMIRVVNYINEVAGFLSNGLIQFVIELLSLIIIFFLMLSIDVPLTFVILSGLPLLICVIFLIRTKSRKYYRDFNNKNSNMNAYINESINGMKITQMFTREEYNNGIFNELAFLTRKKWIRWVRLNSIFNFSINNISAIIYALVFFVGIIVFDKSASTGTLIAMASYAGLFWRPILNIANIYNNLINTGSYLERIFETMDEPVTIHDKKDAYELPPVKGDVEFKNVCFGYEENQLVIKDINLKINAGESVALVGPTGAGKSTIINLICRFYDINSGEILIDGHNIADVTLNSLRSQMGTMLQDTVLFTGTIAENIRYGKLDATDEEILSASKAVRADDFIKDLPNGYNTQIGERGSNLSAGQRQLVSFARTLISSPKILILDEATSSIDARTEALLQEGIKALLKGRTSIIIAHRLSTIVNCDKIMYIDKNQILECGSHKELLEKKGLYYNLYTAQLNDII